MAFSLQAFRAAVLVAMTAWSGWALDLKDLDKAVFDRLSAKANETVDVTLDQNTLRLAANFLSSSGDDDAAHIKRLISGLKSVTVRSFEFKNKGEYTSADVDLIRSLIKPAEWTRIVSVHRKDDGENSDIYILPGKDKPEGLFILAAEPLELTVVYIDGRVDLKDLSALEGFGVPQIGKDGKIEKSTKDKEDK